MCITLIEESPLSRAVKGDKMNNPDQNALPITRQELMDLLIQFGLISINAMGNLGRGDIAENY
jgi:hypothetical protein